MAPDQFPAGLQELQARLCDQHPSPTHVRVVVSLLCGDLSKTISQHYDYIFNNQNRRKMYAYIKFLSLSQDS